MSVFSYEFFLLWLITLLLYFTIAKSWQWQLLLVASIFFYLRSVADVPWILLIVWISTFSAGQYVEKHKDIKGKLVCYGAILLCLVGLFFGRVASVVVTVGNSYFILKAIGYLADIYRDKKAESNIFKYLLYLIFWPTMLEGPFNRIEEFVNHFNKEVAFDYWNLVNGLQRFIWGTFKKIVVSERLGLITTSILQEPSGKGGLFVVLGVLLFALQLYTDFSGFMDMMIGVGTTFGIILPENFKQPFFSKSVSEFWRRWHITLGQWFRDYVMFPFTSSAFIKKSAKAIRKKNKTFGKLVPLLLGTGMVWILTGLWHGFSINYLLWGAFYALIMCISQTIDVVFFKNRERKENHILNILRVIRTIFFVIIADTFICVNSLKSVKEIWHEIFFNVRVDNSSLLAIMGINKSDAIVLGISLLLMLIISVLKEKNKSPQKILNEAPTVIRWISYYALFYVILIWGLYDAQYDVNQFMYMQF